MGLIKTSTTVSTENGRFVLSATLTGENKYLNPELKFYKNCGYLGTWDNSQLLFNEIFPAMAEGYPIAEDDGCIINLEDYEDVIDIFEDANNLGFFDNI